MSGVAAGILLLAAAVFGVLWWRARTRTSEAERRGDAAARKHAGLDAVLGTAPAAVFCWHPGEVTPEVFGNLAGHTGYAGFLAQLVETDAAALSRAIDTLRHRGSPFSAMLSTTAATFYQLDGTATPTGDSVIWVTDVSALRRTEQTLTAAVAAAHQARVAALDALPWPVWRRDANLRIVDCNIAFAEMLDASRETVLAGASAEDMTLPLARSVVTAGAAQTQHRHVVIGGSRRLLELVETPRADGGTNGFARDLTTIENAQSELQRHIDAHGQVLESIHAAVAIYGPDKRLGFFNSAFRNLWALEEDWLESKPALDEVLERLRERRRAPEYADFRAFKRQQLAMFTSLIELRSELMHLPDGRTLSLSVSPHPLGGLTFVYEDVTDRLTLERSYNTLIEVQRETLDNLFEGIAVFGSDGRLKLHNPAYRQMWGLSVQDVADAPHFADIAAPDWDGIRLRITAGITAHTAWTGQIDRHDGSVLHLATVPLPDGAVLFIGRDITDGTRVERALRDSNAALETASQLKSEFIANVSYELRTPLNAIIGFSEILNRQYFGPLNPRQLEYSRGILTSSHRLMSLINDILDLATLEAGYMALEIGEVGIPEMLEAVVALTRERARAQQIDLSVDCAPDIGAIEADERRLKQVLFNLVSNAIKFTPAGKSVRVSARVDEGDVVLAVSDTGIGIPLTEQERIFEKFERGKPHSREAGAGLGLSLVKSFIELHGGTVAIDSEPGRGTTITCRLPGSLRVPKAQSAA